MAEHLSGLAPEQHRHDAAPAVGGGQRRSGAGPGGVARSDCVALASEHCDGEPLLVQVMRDGRRLGSREPLAALRERCMHELSMLPPALHVLSREPPE